MSTESTEGQTHHDSIAEQKARTIEAIDHEKVAIIHVIRSMLEGHQFRINVRDPRNLDDIRPFDFVPSGHTELPERIYNLIAEVEKRERERIKSDLLAIADAGEYEDLRREVERYFNH